MLHRCVIKYLWASLYRRCMCCRNELCVFVIDSLGGVGGRNLIPIGCPYRSYSAACYIQPQKYMLQVWPNPPRRVAVKDPDAKHLDALKVKKDKRFTPKTKAVRFVGPDAGIRSDSGSDSDGSQSIASIYDEPPPPPPPPPSDGPQRLRQPRSFAWGPFKIAKVFLHHRHAGWGATCGRHHNDAGAHTQCKKQLVFGRARPLSDSQCIIGLKKWLILGFFLDPNETRQRTLHVSFDARAEALQGTRGRDLDQELQDAMAGAG